MLDQSLLSVIDVTHGAVKDAVILVNSEDTPAELRACHDLEGGRLFTVAATRIAVETIGRPIPMGPWSRSSDSGHGVLPDRRGGRLLPPGVRQEVPSQGGRGQRQGADPQLRGGHGRMNPKKRRERTTCPAPARAPETTWDISDVDSWGPDRHELGAVIPAAGNSASFLTGGWRSIRYRAWTPRDATGACSVTSTAPTPRS